MQNTGVQNPAGGLDIVTMHEIGSFDAWQAKRWTWDCAPIYSEGPDHPYKTNTWTVYGLIFSEAIYGDMANQHTERHIQNTGQYVFIYRLVDGDSWVRSGNHSLKQNTGDLVIVDYAQPFESLSAPSHAKGIFCTHARLGVRPGDLPPISLVSGSSLHGQLLHNELSFVYGHLKHNPDQLNHAMLQRLIAAVRRALNSDADDLSSRQRSKQAVERLIKRHIEANLDNPETNANALLEQFGVSRAGLYRMFESHGGVRNYISERRLVRALFEIGRNPFQRGIIHQTAERWGFSSDANFNRFVKTRFGVRPGALFAVPLESRDEMILPPV